MENLSATAKESGNQDLLNQLKQVNPNPGLTEAQVKEMFLTRLDPTMKSLTSKVEDIGKTVVGLLQSDLETEQKAQLAKTGKSLENGVLDSLVKGVSEIFGLFSDFSKGVGEQIQAFYKADKPRVTNFAIQWLQIMKETFKHAMSHDPFMKIALMMNNIGGTQNLLPKEDRKAANKAMNFPNN